MLLIGLKDRKAIAAATNIIAPAVRKDPLPWQSFIGRYDRAAALSYFDLPYNGFEEDYGRALFSRDRFEEMAEHL